MLKGKKEEKNPPCYDNNFHSSVI